MSEVVSNESVEEVIPEAETEGQITEAIEEIESLSEQEIEMLPVNEYGDKYVSVQVNGDEVRVPLSEALSGYQRQADYTRKTQELSEQRKQVQYASALAEALQNDPAATLQLLQQQYGVVTKPEEDEYLDPAEKQMQQLEQRIAAFEQSKAIDELTRTIDSLQSKYGDDFNADEVVAKALASGSTDLEAVFKQITFDKVYSTASEAKKKLVEDQSRVEAKRSASVVSGGSANKNSVAPKAAKPTSVFEAFEQAKKTLNY